MGRIDLRDQYAAQALKLADRLTPLERFYIEGYYYSGRPETTGRATEASPRARRPIPPLAGGTVLHRVGRLAAGGYE